MPIYEYYCAACRKRYSFLVRSIASHTTPACPKCRGTAMERRYSTFAMAKGDARRADELASSPDLEKLADLDHADPRDLARLMRKMGGEMGEDLGEEFNEACARLEAGEDPDKIDAAMGLSGEEGVEGGMRGGRPERSDSGLYEA